MLKETPSAPDIEENLIAAVLLDNYILDECSINPEHFWSERNRTVWRAMQHLYMTLGGVEPASLMEHLRVEGNLEKAGGPAYILGLMDSTGTGAMWDVYEQTLIDHYNRREIIRVTERSASRAYNLEDPNEILNDVEHFLTNTKVSKVGDINYAIEAASRYATGEALVKTGFPTLDNAFGGFTRNDLTIIGARTSTGKSAFIHAIADNIAQAEGGPVLVFTPDQPIPEILALQAAREARTPLALFRHGKATDAHKEAYMHALKELRNTFLQRVNFRPGLLTLDNFQTESIRAIRNGAKAIVVDTVNRFSGKSDKMHVTLAEFGTMAKAIASEYDVPIIALAQMRRELDWEERYPTRADLADAPGALANDANMILLLHREKEPEKRNVFNVIVDKAKADAAGGRTLQLYFDDQYVTPREWYSE